MGVSVMSDYLKSALIALVVIAIVYRVEPLRKIVVGA